MIDEEKQTNNTADLRVEPVEVQQAMTSNTAIEMNLNNDAEASTQGTAQPNAQVNAAYSDETASAATEAADAKNQQELSQMQAQIESLKAQLEERHNQYVRIAADFENFRKRNQKEKEDLEQQVKRTTLTELLPVVDNFERARSQIKPQTDAEMNIHKSYQSVYKQLVDCLKRLGVSPMRPEGKEFDPNLHEAIMRQATDEQPEGTVLEELVRGYFLGDRVLRHAMVKVAAPPEPNETSVEISPPISDS